MCVRACVREKECEKGMLFACVRKSVSKCWWCGWVCRRACMFTCVGVGGRVGGYVRGKQREQVLVVCVRARLFACLCVRVYAREEECEKGM